MPAPTAAVVFDDYNASGIPSSGKKKVKKSEARAWGAWVESIIAAFTSSGGLIYSSLALLNADLAHGANSMAWVLGDATVANNGVYRKNGASGTGSWTRVSDLPFSFIIASDIGAGAPNAIQATTSLPVSASALVWMNIFEANTASPVTVSFNGGSALTIKTNSGNDIAAGGLAAGMIVAGIVYGSTFRLLSDQVSSAIVAAAEAAQAAAEAAQTAAEAAAASVNIRNVATRTALKALNTAVTTLAFLSESGREGNFKWTSGDYSAQITADTAEGIFIKADSIASTAGAWVRQAGWAVSPVVLEWFGGKAYTYTELVALNGAASINTRAAANSVALQAADALVSFMGGGRIAANGQIYVVNARYERSSGVYLIGAGVGAWEPIYPQRLKTWVGTTFLFKGTGTKDVTFDGITSGEKNGGWRPDPLNVGQFFKLWSAYNSDAIGTTPATKKQFSVGFLVKENVRYGGFQHLRVCNWVGSDGVSDWSNQAMSSLGDNWDFGYVFRNSEYNDDYNFEVVGGFREAAAFQAITAIADSAGERNLLKRCKFSSRRGLMIRGPDIVKVISATSNSITIPWTSENYHNPAGGVLRGSDGLDYTYTGVTHAGSDANMVLTGVSPNPSALASLRHASAGVANTEYENCYIYGLDHVSGALAETFGFPDSRALEVSGFPIRGVKFDLSSKFHTRERIIAHLHHTTDLTMFSVQFEGGGYVMASPAIASQSWASAAVWETRGLVIIGSNGLDGTGVNDTMFLPRNSLITERQISPRSDLNGHLYLKPETGKDAYIQNFSGSASVRAFDGGTVGITAGSTSRMQFFTSGSVGAGADNTQSLGTSSFRWSQLFAGTATINTSDERVKEMIAAIRDIVLDAWADVEWVEYKFKDAMTEKGDNARVHFGLIAQRVRDVFDSHGLDALEFGLLCHDSWDASDEVVEPIYDAEGVEVGSRVIVPAVSAGDRYGLRYEECFAIEAAYQRRRMDRLEGAIVGGPESL